MNPKRYIVGVSGASGAIYACRLIEALLKEPDREVHCVTTAAGMRVMGGEMPRVAPDATEGGPLGAFLDLSLSERARLIHHANADIGAGPASGTFRTAAMIIVPCSMNTLGCVAQGVSPNLLTRAAAVTLKEGRPLILVPRETPFTLIDLRNMTAVAEAGGVILPANPGFYHNPSEIEEVVGYVVQKILDRLGIESAGSIRWGETPRH